MTIYWDKSLTYIISIFYLSKCLFFRYLKKINKKETNYLKTAFCIKIIASIIEKNWKSTYRINIGLK